MADTHRNAAAPRGAARALVPLLLIGALTAACGERAPGRGGAQGPRLDLPANSPTVLGEVADFALVERSGRTLTRADLAGRPWIATLFFTTCSGPCPRLSGHMRELQEELAGTPVRLVSISVDPARDTPDVLASYAASYTADPERWLFLTGETEEIDRLVRESFALAVDRLPLSEAVLGLHVTHQTRLVVVDGEGRLRGYYDGEDPAGVDAARERALFLAGVRPERRTLPAVNASLNGLATVLLLAGWLAIRRGLRDLHANLMLSAFVVSAAFLACYLVYHFVVVPEIGTMPFRGTGIVRGLYLALLLTHVLGAIVNLPMVLRTLWLARRGRWEAHRRLARLTWPLWMYVSVTGVLVYLCLYVWNPAAPAA